MIRWSLEFDTVTLTIIYSPKNLKEMPIYHLAQNNMMAFKTISVLLPLFVLKFWFDNKFLDKVSSNAQILSTIEISWSLGFDTITFDNYLEPKKRGKVVQKLACYLAILCEFFSEYLSEALVFDLFQIGFYPLVLCVKIMKWYFTLKIVLTYCEKKLFL